MTECNGDFWDRVLKTCDELCDRVGNRLLQDFGTLQAVEKSDGSLVTAADRWSDAELRQGIQLAFPDHGVVSEETIHIFPDNDWCWVIDPVDGTTNFTRGIPLWGISIGLLYQGTPVFGFVRMPTLRQSFYGYWAGDSGLVMPVGAFRDGVAIAVSSDNPSSNHFFNLCARSIGILKNPIPAKIRMLGISTYNLLTVAMGAALGGVEATPKIWDIAATWAIVQAAGGCWVALDDKPIFPLTIGVNYSDRSYPTLAVSQESVRVVFEPLVRAGLRL
ncbi:MAG: inositol monophosphatase family protein [Alkalinema sp. CAN_BIN05]|nr:inositol monophosphatase family protein [Alkalinema sp. CAN_BIN05]